jgi:hypothetical protein
MKQLIPLVIAAFLAAGTSPVLAKSIQKRQAKQEHRIQRGIHKGKLTPKETAGLRNQQATVSVEKALAMKDGKMSRRERADIRHDQNRLSKDIRHKKANKRRVYQ